MKEVLAVVLLLGMLCLIVSDHAEPSKFHGGNYIIDV